MHLQVKIRSYIGQTLILKEYFLRYKKNRRQYPYPNDGHPSAILKLWIAFNESVETVSVEVLQSGITVNVQFQIKHCIFLFHLMVY